MAEVVYFQRKGEENEKQKRTIRILVIALVAVIVVAAAVVLLKKDKAGYNYFERRQQIASVGSETITKGEYSTAFNEYYSNISTYNLYALYYGYGKYYDVSTEAGVQELKTDMLDSLIQQKAYRQIAKELGITLTDEELDECRKTGQEAYQQMYESCVESAKNAGSTTPETYADTLIATYFSNMGLTKSGFIAYKTEAAQASKLADKVDQHYKDEKNITEEELPALYEQYVQDNYVKAYADGAYANYERYRKQGSVTLPYLYIPEGFVFIRDIEIEDEAVAKETMTKIEEGGVAAFEEALKDENVNQDTFLSTLGEDEGYGIGDKDSLFSSEIYDAAKDMAVDEIKLVEVKVTTENDGKEEEKSTWYIIRRIEGIAPGVLPYEKVAEEIKDDLESSVKSQYAQEQIQAWIDSHNVTKDEEAVKALNPVA